MKRSFGILSAAHFICDTYSSFVAPWMPIIIAIYSLSLTKAGLLISLYAFSASIMQPVFGWISDKIGKKYFILFSPLISAVFLSSLVSFKNFFFLILFLLIGGMGVSAFHPSGASLANLLHSRNPGFGVALFAALGTLGNSLGPSYASLAVSFLGKEYSFFAAIPGIIFSLLLFKSFSSFQEEYQPSNYRINEANEKPYSLFILLFLMVMNRSFAQLSLSNYLPVYYNRLGYSIIKTGLIVSLIMAMAAIGGIFGAVLYKKIGLKNTFLLGNFLSIIFLGIFIHVRVPFSFVFLALGSFTLFFPGPLSVAVAQEIVPGAKGTASAFMMGFAWGIGGFLVPITGVIADHYSLKLSLELIFIIPTISLILSLIMPSSESLKY